MEVPCSESGHPVGQYHHRAKLSDAQVAEMRQLHEVCGLSAREIAGRIGCSWSLARKVCNYTRRNTTPKKWRHMELSDEQRGREAEAGETEE